MSYELTILYLISIHNQKSEAFTHSAMSKASNYSFILVI